MKGMKSNKNTITFKRIGSPKSHSKDFFHNIMKMSWLQFFFLFVLSYLLINSLFALLYLLGGNSILNTNPESFWDAFMFSFQTSTTIGYGHYLPSSTYAHVIVIFDAMSGILFSAVTTGMAVIKFSRPLSRVLFSKNILIHNMDGQKTLSFRMGNARSSEIVDAKVSLVVTRPETTSEGIEMRRIYDLELVRSHSPLFILSWTVMHKINENSPLYNMTESELQSSDVSFIISMTGIDDVFSQTVYDRYIYWGNELVLAKKFVDITGFLENGERYIDYNKFHDIEPNT